MEEAEEGRLSRILPRFVPSLSATPTAEEASEFLRFGQCVVDLGRPAVLQSVARPMAEGLELLARYGDFDGLAALFGRLQDSQKDVRVLAARYLCVCLERPFDDNGPREADVDALKLWWAENREIVHWSATLHKFVAW